MSERGDPAEPLSHGVETDEDIVLEQAETGLDEDDRLRPEFLSAVLDAVEEGDNETARDLVSPLHPADIADLLELTPSERRGVNYNVAGPIVVGVEGTASKGVSGDIDWEYGVAGRAGVKAGKDSLIFGKVGYKWVNFDALGPDSPDFHGTTYGAGVELSPADMGGSAQSSNIRLRVQADTMGNFRSIRPMAGVVAKF